MKKIINGYIEKVYGTAPVSENTDIRVLTSEKMDNGYVMVDIRKYSLYGNTFDGIKRPTKKGIKFRLVNIRFVMIALMDILIDYGMVDQNVGISLKDQIDMAIKL